MLGAFVAAASASRRKEAQAGGKKRGAVQGAAAVLGTGGAAFLTSGPSLVFDLLSTSKRTTV